MSTNRLVFIATIIFTSFVASTRLAYVSGVGAGQDVGIAIKYPTLEKAVKELCPKGKQCEIWISDPTQSTSFIEMHIPLTAAEKLRWKTVTIKANAAFKKESKAEKEILKAHNFVTEDPCHFHAAIRDYEDFIFYSVPDNVDYKDWGRTLSDKECKEKLKALYLMVPKWYRADGSLVKEVDIY